MVSDFIEQHDGFLKLSDEDNAVVQASDPTVVQTARVLLEYGAKREGYWTSAKSIRMFVMLQNIDTHQCLTLLDI